MSYEEEKQDRKIERLEAEIERLRAELARVAQLRETEIDQAGAAERMYLEGARLKDARIQELEDALVEERARWCSRENTGAQLSQAGDQFQKRCRRSARLQLQAEGKIGPDVMPRSWQITDERTTALDRVLNYMDYMYPKSSPYYHCTLDVSVLRAMLEEAGQ